MLIPAAEACRTAFVLPCDLSAGQAAAILTAGVVLGLLIAMVVRATAEAHRGQ